LTASSVDVLVNVEAAKGMNDLVRESSMKVGINVEQMEGVLKEPATGHNQWKQANIDGV
jgi:hypothetical protein